MPTPASPARAWLTVAVLMLMYVVSYLDRFIISLMVEPIKQSLAIDDFGIGLVHGLAFAIFYALFGLPMGWLVDRFPARKVVFCGMLAWSLAAAACGLAKNFMQLFGARLGVGAGEATLVPAANAIISKTFPPQRVALALAIFSSGSVLGSTLAYLAGGYIIGAAASWNTPDWLARFEPWQLMFFITGLPGVALAFLAFAVPEHRSPAVGPDERQEQLPLMPYLAARRRYFTCSLLGVSLVAVLAYGTATWAPSFLIRHHGLPVHEVATLLGISSLIGGSAGFIFAGWAADRLFLAGRHDAHLLPILYALPIALIVASINFLWVESVAVFAVLYGLTQFLLPMATAVGAHIQLATPPAMRGRAAALKITVEQLLGISVGPALVAAITEFGLRDPARVGHSIVLMYVGLVPIAIVILALGRGPAREALRETLA